MEDINLPDPIHMPGLRAKLDVFAADHDKIHKWAGSSNIATLFYLYLFNKYKSHCVLSSEYNSTSPLGLYIKTNDLGIGNKIRAAQFDQLATQFVKCVTSGIPVIIIPLVVDLGQFGAHSNVLIYRKNSNTIEHFEPHGKLTVPNLDASVIGISIQEFVDVINSKLDESDKVKLLHAEDVCPKRGLQKIECKHGTCLESKGYCLAWSLFMTELALRNPEIPSRVLIDNIMDHIETKNGGEYLRKVIQGYVILIYDKIDRYYSAMVGSPLTPDVLAEVAGNVPMKEWVGVLVKVEMELMNDPKISTKKYIHRLRKFKTSVKPKWIKYENENKWYNPEENRIVHRNPEPGNTRKIHIATRMSKLMNPSHSSRTLSDNSTTLSSSIPFEPNHSSPNNNPYFNSPRSQRKYSRSTQYPSSSPQYPSSSLSLSAIGNKRKRTPSSNSASKRKHPVLDNNNSSKTRRNSKDN